MKLDNSRNNFEYRSLPIDKVAENPDEYIIPECQEACFKFWNNNIFTTLCSNRKEHKIKYIFVSSLSDENRKIFDELVKSNPKNYFLREIDGKNFYGIAITSAQSDLDIDSQKLADLATHFKMQDVLEGYLTLEDFYTTNIALYKNPSAVKSLTQYDLTAAIKRYLIAFEKLDLLDIDRKIVYNSEFYKNAHQRYLDWLKKQNSSRPDPHEL